MTPAGAAIFTAQKVDLDPHLAASDVDFPVKYKRLRSLLIPAFYQQLLHGPVSGLCKLTVVQRQIDVHASDVRFFGRWT